MARSQNKGKRDFADAAGTAQERTHKKKRQTKGKRDFADAAGTAQEQTKKKKRRRPVVSEPGPEPEKLRLAQGAKKPKPSAKKGKVKGEARGRKRLSPEAMEARRKALALSAELERSLVRGTDGRGEIARNYAGDAFADTGYDDLYNRRSSGKRITGRLL